MTDQLEGDFYSGERLEATVNEWLFSMVALCADPAGAAKRLKVIKAATAELVMQQGVAEKVVAEADAKSAQLAKDESSLVQRTADFQNWVETTERNYRERENRIRSNETIQDSREKKLLEQEADLARRASAHEQRLQNLKDSLN
jgi:hypothetical protein